MDYRPLRELHPVSRVVEEVVGRLRIQLGEEEVGLEEAVGRYASRDLRAERSIPDTDKAVVDGFAVRSIDVQLASPTSPASLRLGGRILIGEYPERPIEPYEAFEISTGAPLPPGADAVVMVEDTRIEGGSVFVYRSVRPGYGVARKGEDVAPGDVLVRRGSLIRPWHVALAASQGYTSIWVYERPCAMVLNVGDEVVRPGSPLPPGKIYDTTGYLVRTWLRTHGLSVVDAGITGDDASSIRRFFEEALEKCPFAFTIGGTSIGLKDLSARVLEELADEYYVHGFAMKPGRPAALAVIGGRLAMSLSGYPVAALAELSEIFRPIYYKGLGLEEPPRPLVRAVAARRIPGSPGMRHIYRVKVCRRGDTYIVTPLRLTGSGVLSTLIRGNGILVVPEDVTGIEEGDEVEVELLSWPYPEEECY